MSTEFAVSGIATFTGTNACNGACTETLDFSFDWLSTCSPVAFGSGTYCTGNVIAGSADATAFGAIDNAASTVGEKGAGQYIAFGSPSTSFDIYVDPSAWGDPNLVPPQPINAWMYSCATAQCSNDFFEADYNRPVDGPLVSGVVSGSVTQVPVPEPSPLPLVSFGILSLCALGFGKHRFDSFHNDGLRAS
ncbi:MAG: hypothetical protein ACRD4S_11500 [Candidatus Acidiferrales bacterium]